MNKWLINSKDIKMHNLANIVDISVSCNYLVLTTIDGREERVIYGAEDKLKKLYEAIKGFIVNSSNILDVCNYV